MIEALFNIPVLFFIVGVIAVFIGSDLNIPRGLLDSITLYLMLAIGIKGGISLASEPITLQVLTPTIIVVLGSIAVASYMFFISKKITDKASAAGIAATYGSNSTMTFITAASFLTTINVEYGGYMTVALVLMETPAILYGVFLASKDSKSSILSSLSKAVRDGTQLLLISSLVIGYLTVKATNNSEVLYSFISGDIFTGALCFFLLAMGIKVASALKSNSIKISLIVLASIAPWINGGLGYVLGSLFNLSTGDLFLTTMLMASSSYIVAPAILSKAVPSAEVGQYLTMSIGITFPINLLLGISLWWYIIGY